MMNLSFLEFVASLFLLALIPLVRGDERCPKISGATSSGNILLLKKPQASEDCGKLRPMVTNDNQLQPTETINGQLDKNSTTDDQPQPMATTTNQPQPMVTTTDQPQLLATTMDQPQSVATTEGQPPCASSPCQNGAACSNIGDSYECECPWGSTGQKCDGRMLNREITDQVWTLIQRRRKINERQSTVFENAYWNSYKNGFGAITDDDYWIGMKEIMRMTENNNWQLWIEIKWDKKAAVGDLANLLDDERKGQWSVGIFDSFKVDTNQWKLTIADDPVKLLNMVDLIHESVNTNLKDMLFSTRDNDADESNGDCSYKMGGGWWFNNCASVCLNCRQVVVLGGFVHFPSETIMAIKESG